MLVIQHSKQPLEKCSPNILPCRINYNGPSKVAKRFWSPATEKDKTSTSYFRGRRLRGRIVKVPDGYQGIIATSTDRVLPDKPTKRSLAIPEESDPEELDYEEAAESVKILEAVATFDEVTAWGHDQVPAADDTFIKGVEEWIAFAEAIHHDAPTKERANDRTGS